MDRFDIRKYGETRHGKFWIPLLAKELGYDQSSLWRVDRGHVSVSPRLVEGIALLPPCPRDSLSPSGLGWKPVPGFSDFLEAAADGSVRSIKFRGHQYRGRLLKPVIDNHGYPYVIFSAEGKRLRLTVHRIIATTFLGPRPEGMQIDHVDGNKLNNAASNLEYVTPRENMRRAYRLGLVKLPPAARSRKRLAAALEYILNDSSSSLSEQSRRVAALALSNA
jgi:hypothetical protein